VNKRIIASAATTAVIIAAAGTAIAATSTTTNGSNYTPLTSYRLFDSHPTPNTIQIIPVAGQDGVPADATAAVVNLTVTAPQTSGYLVAWANGHPRPNPASNVDFAAGQTIANQATVPINHGQINLENVSGGTAQVTVDLEGYYEPAAPAYTPPQTISQTLAGVASVNTGGSFNSRATQVGTVTLPAGSYLVTVSAKATPIVQSDPTAQVFPSIHLYDQPKNPSFAGDVLQVGNGALESGAYTAADAYYSNSGVVTLTAATTMYVYAFGYDSNDGEGTYALDGVTVTATPVNVTGTSATTAPTAPVTTPPASSAPTHSAPPASATIPPTTIPPTSATAEAN